MHAIRDLPAGEFEAALSDAGVPLHVGPYVYNIRSNLPAVAAGIRLLYADFPLANQGTFIDFDVGLWRAGALSRLRGEARFLFDQKSPFDAIPIGQAYAFLEWGMNWCVSIHANEYLKLHAAVVSRGDTAVIMPGVPGAGKSTLCAALGLTGWRVLSDEHAMIPPNTTEVVPLYRPVSLKNESIDVIRAFCPSAILGPLSKETHKGIVAHLKADLHPESHARANLHASAMIFPRFSRDEPQRLSLRRRTDSFVLAAYHSFNYSLLGEAGFEAMKLLIANVDCYDIVYHDLTWATQAINELPIAAGVS